MYCTLGVKMNDTVNVYCWGLFFVSGLCLDCALHMNDVRVMVWAMPLISCCELIGALAEPQMWQNHLLVSSHGTIKNIDVEGVVHFFFTN